MHVVTATASLKDAKCPKKLSNPTCAIKYVQNLTANVTLVSRTLLLIVMVRYLRRIRINLKTYRNSPERREALGSLPIKPL